MGDQLEGDLSTTQLLEQGHDGKWHCDICNCVQEKKEDLLNHRIMHLSSNNDSSKQCPICKKAFTSSAALRNHLTVHTGVKKYTCKYCSRQFGWKTQLHIHENLHTGKGLHQCNICSKPFSTKWLLQRHTKIHDKNGPERKRRKHKFQERVFHSPIEKGVTIVTNKSNDCINEQLQQSDHLRESADGNDRFQCHACQGDFKSNEELAYHLLSHNLTKQAYSKQNETHISDKFPEKICSGSHIDNPIESMHIYSNEHMIGRSIHSNEETNHANFNEQFDNDKTKHTSNAKPSLPKSSLTSIVTKLHHKVDEQQKAEDPHENTVNGMVVNFQGSSKEIDINSELHMQIQTTKQGLAVKSTDPFISGIGTDCDFNSARPSGAFNTYVSGYKTSREKHVPEATGPSSTLLVNAEKHLLPITQHERSTVSQEFFIQKQNDEIAMLKKELLETKSCYEKEFSNLNSKIDCLTNLVSSQSLILNRMLLGGKMVVNGTLDFTLQQNKQ